MRVVDIILTCAVIICIDIDNFIYFWFAEKSILFTQFGWHKKRIFLEYLCSETHKST